jgi:hypothetical protein
MPSSTEQIQQITSLDIEEAGLCAMQYRKPQRHRARGGCQPKQCVKGRESVAVNRIPCATAHSDAKGRRTWCAA